jgi:hypothetical protein
MAATSYTPILTDLDLTESCFRLPSQILLSACDRELVGALHTAAVRVSPRSVLTNKLVNLVGCAASIPLPLLRSPLTIYLSSSRCT